MSDSAVAQGWGVYVRFKEDGRDRYLIILISFSHSLHLFQTLL